MALLSSSSPSSVLSLQFKRNFLVARSIPGGKCSQSVPKMDILKKEHNFIKGSRLLFLRHNSNRFTFRRKSLCVSASWVANTQTAGDLFTFGTVAVLPFYALMVLAPKSNLTKRTMDCHIPYVLLGALYSFLLYLSWTPDKMQLLFASKYLLPELSSISQMFTNDIALASAWIHLLAVDLFAASYLSPLCISQVFHDGQKHNIETRHSITLCLFFCPIGIMTHAFTRALTKRNSGEE